MPAKSIRKPSPAPSATKKAPRQATRKEKAEAVKIYIFRLVGDDRSASGEREMVLTHDLPLPENQILEEFVSRLCGPGPYRVEFRDASNRIIEVVTVLVGETVQPTLIEPEDEPLDDEDDPGPSLADIERLIDRKMAMLNPRPATAAAPSPSLAETVNAMLTALKSLDDLRSKTPPAPEPNPAPSLVDQIKQLREIEELIRPRIEPPQQPQPEQQIEAIVTKLLSTGVISSSDGDETPAWVRLVLPMAPAIGKAIENLAESVRLYVQMQAAASAGAATRAIVQGQPAAPMPTPGANPAQPAQAQFAPQQAAPSQPAGMTVEEMQGQILGRVMQALVGNEPVEPIADMIDNFMQQYPMYAQTFSDLLNMKPEEAVGLIAQGYPPIAMAPHAADWIARLQRCFWDEDESTNDNGADGAETREEGPEAG